MIIIGELINASRKSIARYIEQQDSEAVKNLALEQYQAGADYIDVNAGVYVGEEIKYLKWLIGLVQEVVPIPCCIDSPDPKAIEAVLGDHKGVPMVNSISLEKDRFEQLLPLVAGTDLKVVALCMSEDGMPETADQRMQIADKLINSLVKNNVALENIYVDPLVQPISVNQDFGLEFLNAIERIMTTFKGVHTTCGLSNISYGLPDRHLLNRQFMAMAITKGLDGAIVNPLDKDMMEVIVTTETLAGKDDYCRNYLTFQKEAAREKTEKHPPLKLDSRTGAVNMVRMQTAIDHKVADQIPFTLNVNGPYFSYFCGISANDYYNFPKIMLQSQLAVYHRFGRTTTITPEMSLAPEASAIGAEINWSEDGTAWVEPFIETEADVDALVLPDLKNAGYMTKVFEFYDYIKENLDEDIPVTLGAANSPFTIAALIRGTSEFLGDLVLAPEFARKLLRKVTDLVLMYLKEQQRVAPPESFKRILLFDDLSGFVNLQQFREFVLPLYEEIYGTFPECQRWNHNDSDTTHILEGIAEAGIQVFHYGYQVDAAYAKEIIGDRVCLMGNVTPLEILRNGTVAQVEKAVHDVIQKSARDGGLIIAAGGYIDEGTPVENIEAMIRSCETYGKKEQIENLVLQEAAAEKKSGAEQVPSVVEEDDTLDQYPTLIKVKEAIVEGDLGNISTLIQSSLDENFSPQEILDLSIVPGMDRVGSLFSSGEIFIPEMMMAARCTKIGMDILNPILATTSGGEKKGTIAIGTVLGDLHDIGKDIVISMMQGAGLEVIDLGVDCSPEKYCQAVEDGADLIGMSAILTTVIPNMEATVKMLESKGLRDRCKVLIGGAAVTPSSANDVGADAYCVDAGEGVQIAKQLLAGAM